MSPKLRSIFAQVHRKSVSMVSRRDFSSSAGDSKWILSSESDLERVHKFSTWFRNGLWAWASLEAYKVYKNYYPKLLKAREEHKLRLQRQNELFAQARKNRDK